MGKENGGSVRIHRRFVPHSQEWWDFGRLDSESIGSWRRGELECGVSISVFFYDTLVDLTLTY